MGETDRYYYQKLYEVAAAINSAGTPDKVLGSLVENVAKALKAKGCSIMLLTPDRKSLIHSVSYGLSNEFIERGPRSVEKSLPETVVGKGRVAVVQDVNAEPSRVHYPDAAKKEGIISILAVPITLRDDIVGEMRIYTSEAHHFSDNDIYFAKSGGESRSNCS